MIPFSDCRRCMEAPRESFRLLWVDKETPAHRPGPACVFDAIPDTYPDVEAIYRVPEALGLVGFVGPAGPLWRCPDCGTFYYLEVFNRGSSCQTYLWRLTPAEAMEPEPYGFWPRLGTPEYEEFHRYQQRLPQWKHEMQACLSHSDSMVRERAAQALASHFRARSELAGFKALLGYADASIRRGALLAFDSIRFIRFECGPADIVPDLLKSLMDADASVARQAFVQLSRVHDEVDRRFSRARGVRGSATMYGTRQARRALEQILDQVRAIPTEQRTAVVRMFLATNGGSVDALVAGLADSEEEVRQCAFYHALKVSLGNTSLVTMLRTTLRDIPEANRTPEMDAYLARENPDEWDDDD